MTDASDSGASGYWIGAILGVALWSIFDTLYPTLAERSLATSGALALLAAIGVVDTWRRDGEPNETLLVYCCFFFGGGGALLLVSQFVPAPQVGWNVGTFAHFTAIFVGSLLAFRTVSRFDERMAA